MIGMACWQKSCVVHTPHPRLSYAILVLWQIQGSDLQHHTLTCLMREEATSPSFRPFKWGKVGELPVASTSTSSSHRCGSSPPSPLLLLPARHRHLSVWPTSSLMAYLLQKAAGRKGKVGLDLTEQVWPAGRKHTSAIASLVDFKHSGVHGCYAQGGIGAHPLNH